MTRPTGATRATSRAVEPVTTAITVLAKPPRFGRAKSRLAADVGAGPAARLARAMLLDTWRATNAVAGTASVTLAIAGERDEYPHLVPTPHLVPQVEGDLGRRMASLVAHALSDVDRVLLLGTDSPGLPDGHVRRALALLDEADIVVGPTTDGGFWCLGARAGHAALGGNTWLDELDWERSDTCRQVEERTSALGLTIRSAPSWFDIDRGSDLEELAKVVAATPGAAPETTRVLATDLPASLASTTPASLLPQPTKNHVSTSPSDGALDQPTVRPSTTPTGGARELPTAGAATTPADVAGSPALVSVVVASLDEGQLLDGCLDALAAQPPPVEIIVADGGSQDGSDVRAAARPGVTVVTARPGRGEQLAAGARMATGDVLLFLHVDTRLPADGTTLVRDALADGTAEAGAFVTRTTPDPSLPNLVGPLLRLADIRSRFTRRPYGDQAIFVTRSAYEDVGGIRALPIMEDYDLSDRLAARRELVRIRTPVAVSGRRMQRHPLRSLLLMRIIPPLYRLGVNPATLARLYRGR